MFAGGGVEALPALKLAARPCAYHDDSSIGVLGCCNGCREDTLVETPALVALGVGDAVISETRPDAVQAELAATDRACKVVHSLPSLMVLLYVFSGNGLIWNGLGKSVCCSSIG